MRYAKVAGVYRRQRWGNVVRSCSLFAATAVVLTSIIVTVFGSNVSASSNITEFPLSFSGTNNPTGITSGPDGALWFTESGRIGRITTDGSSTQYQVPTSNSTPYDFPALYGIELEVGT